MKMVRLLLHDTCVAMSLYHKRHSSLQERIPNPQNFVVYKFINVLCFLVMGEIRLYTCVDVIVEII